MAQVRQDNVQIKLEIDGSQSKTELDNLTRKAQLLSTGLKEMKRGTDEYIAANKELRDVNARMAELRSEIGTTGLSINQLGKLSAQLSRELKDLTPGTESFINKSKELTQVDSRLAQVRAEARGVKENLEAAGGGIGSFIAKAAGFAGIQLGVQAIAGGLLDLGKSSVAEFQQAAGAAAQLEASLNSTGNAAGLTKQELLDLSTALEGKTIFDGDAITQAQSVLLTFTKIKKGVYEEAVPAITDMATKLAGDGEADLKGATIQVGKALNDPVKGITALAKAGVSFSEDQKTMIKSLVDTGDVAAAQTIILNELKSEFGGSAEAAAKAGTGPLKQFQVQIGNVKEGLGELITDGLQAIQPALAGVLKGFAFLIEALKAAPGFLVENRGLLLGLAVAILTLNAGNIAATASTLAFAAVEKGRAIATVASATAQRLLNAAMTANPIGLVIAAVALLVGGLVTLYEKSEQVREVVAGLGTAAVQVFKNIKEAVVLELGGVGDLLLGIFTLDPAKIKAGLDSLGAGLKKQYTGLGDGVAGAYHQGYGEREKLEQAAAAERGKQQQAAKVQKAKEDAGKIAAAAAAADLEALKNREANIKAALALVAAGSAEELRLKKQEVLVKRDIDLADEKKTAGDKKVIRAEALRDLRQLQDEYNKKQADANAKRAKEQADVEKKIADLKAGLLQDETEKRIQQLRAAAEKEKATAQGTAEQIAEQRKLIDQKLAVDVAEVRRAAAQKAGLAELDVEKLNNALIKNEFDRRDAEIDTAAREAKLKLVVTEKDYAAKVKAIDDNALAQHQANDDRRLAYRQEVLDKIAAIEDEAQDIQFAQRRKKAGDNEAAQNKIDEDEEAKKQRNLDKSQAAALSALDKAHDLGLISDADYEEAKKALFESFLVKKDGLHSDYMQKQEDREKNARIGALEQMSQYLTTISGLVKAFGDRDLANVDKDKKKRQAQLDSEYKSGKISKEQYEAQKSDIEANYTEKTRVLKKEAAEKEKAVNIAQSIIAGIIAVLQAGGIFTPTGIATAIFSAAATAKIIATPIPEFEKGGVAGGPKPTWRDNVRRFASGGRLNSRAGVADTGQRHSGGGIRMVDGATGEHLGEWERGEPYMILSRDTYANNKHLVDELIDTSLYRGGAQVRPKPGYYADGGTFNTPGQSPTPTAAPASAAGQELVQAVQRVENAVRALPSRQYIGWDQDDTAEIEQRLGDRAADRNAGAIR